MMRVDGSKFAHRDKMLWLSEVPTRMAERYADKAAIIFGDRITTYGDLERGSARLCALWTEAGYRPGDTIGYLGVNSDLFYFALFAAARGQFLLVPFNWRYPQPELAYVLGDARPKLLIYDRDLDERVKGAIASAGTSPELLFTEGDGPDSLRGVLAGPRLPWPALPTRDEAPLLQVYTSGTTGRPKGAVLSHAAISLGRHSDVENPRWKKWTADEVTLSPMPNFHTAGICFVQMVLSVGATCVLTGDPSAKNLLRLILAYKVDHIFVVSTLIRLLLEEIKASGKPPPKIANIHYGAAPMSPALLTEAIEAFGSRFTQYYGMTEAAGSTHFLAPEEHDLKRPHLLRSLGLPLTGVSMEIRRPDGSPCDVNEGGEIWIKSDMIMNGYANRPKETAEVLVDGWYRTGDGGRADAEGYLYLTDRIKDMIITGGENVYPVELENVLRLHPMINDVAVVGIEDEKWGQAVAAILEVTPDFDLSFDDVRNFAKENLAGYKCPRAVFITQALPRTPTAKIQRNAARGLVGTCRKL
jgi:acyl-CoA synthetase (AMP-forming)/AMP-acid ligase II